MRNVILILVMVVFSHAAFAAKVGKPNQVYRMGASGSRPAFGSIDLSNSATVGASILSVANGGTGQSSPGGATTKTSNYTIISTDNLILADATGGGFNLTLPSALANPGKEIHIKKVDSTSNAITLLPTGGDKIDGETSQLLQGTMAGVPLKSDGSANWYVF